MFDIGTKNIINNFVNNLNSSSLEKLSYNDLNNKRIEVDDIIDDLHNTKYFIKDNKVELLNKLREFKVILEKALKKRIEKEYDIVKLFIKPGDVTLIDENVDYFLYVKDGSYLKPLGKFIGTHEIPWNYDVYSTSPSKKDTITNYNFSNIAETEQIFDDTIIYKKKTTSGGKRKSKKSRTIRKVRHPRRKNRKTMSQKRKN